MGEAQGLKLFAESNQVKQEVERLAEAEPALLEGQPSEAATRYCKQNVRLEAEATDNMPNLLHRAQVQVIPGHSSSDSTRACSFTSEQKGFLKSATETSKECAGKKVQRTLDSMFESLKTTASAPTLVKQNEACKHGDESSSKIYQCDGSDQRARVPGRQLRSHMPKQQVSSSKAKTERVVTQLNNMRRRHKTRRNFTECADDAVSKTYKRIRYLVNRINREQNLIDVYSAEGWKGKSLEKIRPEQELKKAESKILQCKRAIRQALEQLELIAHGGSMQESAFDTEGKIYHDDIFCAICQSKESSPDNDIILCDGACNRAFHQFCLQPPLRTEDIPPGEEGWLCPVCDCKFECLDIINEHFATDYEVEDSWEEIFADAAAEATGGFNVLDVIEYCPSEDSEDDDYNPDGGNNDNREKLPGQDNSADTGQSSDGDSSESDSSDASSEVSFFDEFAGTGRSKSRKGALGEDGGNTESNSSDDSSGVSFFDEFAEVSKDEVVPDETKGTEDVWQDAALITGKRQRNEVDYKQLYDEVYGANGLGNDSSEDEDWGDEKKQRKLTKSHGTAEGYTSESKEEKTNIENSESFQGTLEVSKARKSSIRLPTNVVARLREVFEECQLPSKTRKEDLSAQLGISYERVNAWFRNARRTALKKM